MINKILIIFKKLFARLLRKEDGSSSPRHPLSRRCVRKDAWLVAVAELARNPGLTACFTFTNGKNFIIPRFLSGDSEKITGRVNGVATDFWRRGVVNIMLIPVRSYDGLSTILEGVVTTWKDRAGGRFGFIRSLVDQQDYYFNEHTIKDYNLVLDLQKKRVRQHVQFRVVRRGYNGKPSQVEVLQMIENGEGAEIPLYRKGFDAKTNGRVEEAIECYSKIIENPQDANYFSAIKELAECINRQDKPNDAFNLLESHRAEFPKEEMITLDRMEYLYLQKAGRREDAIEILDRILSAPDLPENQRTHFSDCKRRLLSKDQSEKTSSVPGLDSVLKKIEDGISEYSIRAVGKLLGRLVAEERLSDEVVTNAMNIVNKDAKDFLSSVNYEGRFAMLRSMQGRINKCKEGILDGSIIGAAIVALLEKVYGVAQKELSVIEPAFTLSHESVASYVVGPDGMVFLKLVLRLNEESMPSVEEVVASLEGLDDTSVPVCDRLVGGGACDFEILFKPEKNMMTRGVVSLNVVLDFSINGVSGKKDSSTVLVLPVSFERPELPILDNPYQKYAGGGREATPTGKFFVGRGEALAQMVNVFAKERGGVCYLVHGQRRTGKNTLFENLFRELKKSEHGGKYVCSKTSMKGIGCDPQNSFFESLRDRVCDEKDGLGIDVVALQQEINILFSPDNLIGKIAYLGRKVSQAGKVWVVVIDEFTDLNKTEEKRSQIAPFAAMLRTLLDDQVFHLFLVGMDSILQLRYELFANDGEGMRDCPLTYLKLKDLEDLLRGPLEDMVGRDCFRPETTVFVELMNWTAGVPQLAQYMCAGLVDLLNDEGRRQVMDGDIDRVGMRLVQEHSVPEKGYSTFLEMGIPGFDDMELRILYAKIAAHTEGNGFCSLGEVPMDDIVRTLLVDRKAIVVEANRVRLSSRLFAEWLRRAGTANGLVNKEEG